MKKAKDREEKSVLEPPEEERFECEEVREALEKVIGRIDPAKMFESLSRAREHKDQLIAQSRAAIDPNFWLRRVADTSEKGVTVEAAKSPKGSLTFGSTKHFVRVNAETPFHHAALRIKLDPKNIAHLNPDTIFVSHWDVAAKQHRIIPQSGYNAKFGYAFSRISEPGLYTAIGLPRDPRILTTLHLVRALRPLFVDSPREFLPKVCGLILCARDRGKGIASRANEFGFDPEDFVGGPIGGDLCEICLGGDKLFPELDLFDTLDVLPGFGKVQIPPYFPPPCHSWESVGPDNIPGRITALAFDPTNTAIIYAGSAAGGVFKSINNGAVWSPLWERELSLAIGGLAVAPSNASIIYAATGEWDSSVSAIYTMYPGAGVYRSTDAGGRWERLAPISSIETSAVAVDPADPQRVYVAGKRGLHRSRDGGATWDIPAGRTNGVFDGTVSDVVIDPTNSNIIYIGVHGGGVYKSTDRGDTWTLLTNGIVNGGGVDAPKISIGRNGAHGTQFVAVKISNLFFTSIDGGATFSQPPLNTGFDVDQGRYMNVVAVDPTNESVILAGDTYLFRSADGGLTWTDVSRLAPAWMNRIHEDVQAVVIDPTNHAQIFVATDGGVYRSTDNGINWVALHGEGGIPADPIVSSGLVTLQCWTVGVSQTSKLAVGVTSHDNLTYTAAFGNAFVVTNYFNRGEGGWIEYDPKNPAIIYSDNWYSNIVKTTNGDQWWQQQVWTDLGIDTSNLNAEVFRIAWTNTQFLLAIERASGSVRRSSDGGTTWTTVLNVAGVEITAIQFAPSDDNHAYAASSNGRVWHSSNAGVMWTELLRVGLPNQRVHDIEVSWTNPLRVYLALGTRGALAGIGYRPLWRANVGTGNQATWFDISGGLPAVSLPDLGLTGLALDPILQDTIYAANIAGVFRSTDGGDSWTSFDDGLPNCFVSDLDMRKIDRTLWASTMGRGVYRRKL